MGTGAFQIVRYGEAGVTTRGGVATWSRGLRDRSGGKGGRCRKHSVCPSSHHRRCWCWECFLTSNCHNFFGAGCPKANGHVLEPQEPDASAGMCGFSSGTFFTPPYPQPRVSSCDLRYTQALIKPTTQARDTDGMVWSNCCGLNAKPPTDASQTALIVTCNHLL